MSITWMPEAKCFKASIMRQGIRYQVYFSANQHGSKSKAKAEARKWEQKKIRELPERMTSKDKMTNRNKSGVVGVHLGYNITRRKNGKKYRYWRWIAFWQGFSGGIPWAISKRKYNDKDAFVLACLSRKHESTDRKKVLKEFQKIKNTAAYRKILAMKKQSAGR